MADVEKDQKTEAATPRRRQEAREKGQVPMSLELVAALLLLAWSGTLAASGGSIATAIGGTMERTFESLPLWGTAELDVEGAASLMGGLFEGVARVVAFLILPLFLLGVLLGYGQVGFQITPKAVELNPSRINPIQGFGKLFSLRSVMRTVMAVCKITLVIGSMAVIASTQVDEIVQLTAVDVGPALAGIGHVSLRCVAGALVMVLVIALADLAFQRFQHERDMRMTKQEVKEELKTVEGDPHLKARIRRVQREMASRRMMADVPRSTVVVTNPTHYAVALLYERNQESQDGGSNPFGAPRVVAKGVDHVAQRIKELAREAGVLLYEDVPLARSLHAQVEIGDEIPVELYQAVAEVLSYVYRVEGAAQAA